MDMDRIATEIYRTLSDLELPSTDSKWNEPVTGALCDLGRALGFEPEGDARTVTWRCASQDPSDPVPMIAKCQWFRTTDRLRNTFEHLIGERATIKVLVYDWKRSMKSDTIKLSSLVEKQGRPRETYLLFGYEHGRASTGQFHRGKIVTGNVQVSGYGPGRML